MAVGKNEIFGSTAGSAIILSAYTLLKDQILPEFQHIFVGLVFGSLGLTT